MLGEERSFWFHRFLCNASNAAVLGTEGYHFSFFFQIEIMTPEN
jgi:hypothetical protein